MYLLDTHILIWWIAGNTFKKSLRTALSSGSDETPLLVSDVTCWEVAWLVKKRRLELTMPVRDWLEAAVAAPLVRLESVTPAVAAEAITLPETIPNDPADRLIVATARILGATLLTNDKHIVKAGVVKTISG